MTVWELPGREENSSCGMGCRLRAAGCEDFWLRGLGRSDDQRVVLMVGRLALNWPSGSVVGDL